MNDPKYVIRDGRLWHVSGYQIPPDEPVMVLRGKDPFALAAIREYIRRHTDQAHQESAAERHLAFEAYQSAHPERVSTDCTRGAC